MKGVIALAALAAIGFAGVAYAGDATAPKPMSDSEMDKVTAGSVVTGTPSTGMTIFTGHTNRSVEAGSDTTVLGGSGPGAFTEGTQGTLPVHTEAGGGNNLKGTGPGGLGQAVTPAGTRGGCGRIC